ncbi:hypothetical protein NLJ89_g5304 [Agrocybe chaxingu]|uniref:histidine--tRNA ligase n=1 Tax=Agrocybe chaxingu TaxID=84603 RepID=A0A9W8K8H1_9AGAR|nr:hypothetical protein NLJ89_g5304 [Agrocybe chaxingu]
MNKGRMREFTQADFDVTGTWDAMIPDAEILSLLHTILTKLDVGEFTFKLPFISSPSLPAYYTLWWKPPPNPRRYLRSLVRSISSAVDKLDTLPWVEDKLEMTKEKGLDPAVADKIGEYVKHKGGPELLSLLEGDAALTANPSAKQGLSDMRILFTLLKAYGIIERISFDMSLARGLDYYTGIIYEAIVEASAPPGFKAANAFTSAPSSESTASPAPADGADEDKEIGELQVGVGSIAAGGGYDNLVGSFLCGAAGVTPTLNPKDYKKLVAPGAPCVGVSIGIDRIFALLWPKWVERGARAKGTMVYVMSAGDGLLEERVKLAKELRDAGVKTDFAKSKPKIATQFAAGERDEVPFAVILGADQVKAGLVTVEEQRWQLVNGEKVKIESADKGTQVKRDELVNWLKKSEMWGEWEAGI